MTRIQVAVFGALSVATHAFLLGSWPAPKGPSREPSAAIEVGLVSQLAPVLTAGARGDREGIAADGPRARPRSAPPASQSIPALREPREPSPRGSEQEGRPEAGEALRPPHLASSVPVAPDAPALAPMEPDFLAADRPEPGPVLEPPEVVPLPEHGPAPNGPPSRAADASQRTEIWPPSFGIDADETPGAVAGADLLPEPNGCGGPCGRSEVWPAVAGSEGGVRSGAGECPPGEDPGVAAAPEYGENPSPAYPRIARRQGWQGEVVMRVRVSERGRVLELSLERSSGHRILDEAALETVRRWRFRPALSRGVTVESVVLVPVRFELQGRG